MELVYPQERPLVAIDVEAWEKSLQKVTEIGISVYDPTLGAGAMPMVKTYHILPQETLKYRNGKYVPDNKNKYMGGTSYVMPFGECRAFVDAVISMYIVAGGGALVGHHIEGDLKWIRSLGVELPPDVPTVDTLRLYHLTRTTGGTLRGVLRAVDIPHANLHNAANDAYYTLLAALAYCDPAYRQSYGLDEYLETEPVLSRAKRDMKFLDVATYTEVSAAELADSLD